MSNYYDWEEFKGVYLEDSFLLNINENENEIVIKVDAVLNTNNPTYTNPVNGEHYCYRLGFIVFTKVTSKMWVYKSMTPFSDADGELDYGNIDCLKFLKEEGMYEIRGDWGHLKIKSLPPKFKLM